MIAPGDSFAVYMTPPRAGTFIYHSHMENGHDLAAGLYGALVVQDPAARDTTHEIIVLSGGGDPPLYRSVYLNGSLTPPPRALTAGVTYRVRVISIAENLLVNGVVTYRARPVTWKRVAKDGADLPDAARTVGDAAFSLNVGETADFEFTPTEPGDYFLELFRATGVVNRQLWRVSPPKKR
jgi:FtsP/CotA-like multicopper oxidase with cupredoxin domain